MPSVQVAVVQATPTLFDSEACLAKAEALIADAAAGGARLIVFPEAFIGGYPKGEDFGARVGSRTPEGRKLFRRSSVTTIVVTEKVEMLESIETMIDP